MKRNTVVADGYAAEIVIEDEERRLNNQTLQEYAQHKKKAVPKAATSGTAIGVLA